MNKKEIGKNIKSIRQQKLLSREDVSKKLDISIHTLAKYEQGQREPSIDMIEKIAVVLEVPFDKLLFAGNSMIDNLVTKAADHIIDDVYPLLQYVNQNRFEGKYNLETIFSDSDLIDLASLVDDVVSNRLTQAVKKSKTNLNKNNK